MDIEFLYIEAEN